MGEPPPGVVDGGLGHRRVGQRYRVARYRGTVGARLGHLARVAAERLRLLVDEGDHPADLCQGYDLNRILSNMGRGRGRSRAAAHILLCAVALCGVLSRHGLSRSTLEWGPPIGAAYSMTCFTSSGGPTRKTGRG